MFRDGVSEGQFSHVIERDIPLLESAFKKINPKFEPKITFFVVQKRHHTRFMPFELEMEFGLGSGRIGPDSHKKLSDSVGLGRRFKKVGLDRIGYISPNDPKN